MSEKIANVIENIFVGPGQEVEKAVRSYSTDAFGGKVAVLNVADDYPEWPHHRDVLFIHAGLNDGPPDPEERDWGENNSIEAYINAARSLQLLARMQFDRIYVHCHGGNSRSCFIVILYIMMVEDMDFEAARHAMSLRYDRERVHLKHQKLLPDIACRLAKVW